MFLFTRIDTSNESISFSAFSKSEILFLAKCCAFVAKTVIPKNRENGSNRRKRYIFPQIEDVVTVICLAYSSNWHKFSKNINISNRKVEFHLRCGKVRTMDVI